MSQHWLENVYWLSQAALLLAAIGAGYAAHQQLRAYKLFELVRYMDDQPFREARGIVLREVNPLKDTKWWEGGEEVEHMRVAAYLVCAKFDVLQFMIEFDTLDRVLQPKRGYGAFFVQNWAASILMSHEALVGFIAWRRAAERGPARYVAFDRLQQAAAKFRWSDRG